MASDLAAGGRLAGLIFMGLASLHFATAWTGGPARNWHGQTSEYYPLLADAFLAGQTSLLIHPPPEMLALPDPYDPEANANYRLHDASLYHGKYYLYFGPTPAIVLFLPYRVLTGSHLPTRIAVALFCNLGFAFSCLLLFVLARHQEWDLPGWLASFAVLSMGSVPGVAFLLIRPSFYEIAIGAGYCFVMAGFLFFARGVLSERPRAGPLATAGLCFGLAAGCRPDLCVLAVLMAALVVIRFRFYKGPVLAFLVPAAACGILLAIYNFVRFDNPLEFGIRYTLLANRADLGEHFGRGFGNLVPGIWNLAASSPKLLPLAPSMGLVWGAPIAILGLGAPFLMRHHFVKDFVARPLARFTIDAIYIAALVILVLLAFLGFVLGRYTVDFAPEFLLLAWCVAVALWQPIRTAPRLWRFVFAFGLAAATLYSAVLDFSFCVTRVPT